jgi:hypothetical protein
VSEAPPIKRARAEPSARPPSLSSSGMAWEAFEDE